MPGSKGRVDITELSEYLEGLAVIGIVRRCRPERLEKVVGAAVREGLSVVEITLDSVEAATQIAAVRDAFSEVLVGARTVRSVEELEQALGAGARFVVTPVLSEEVLAACAERRIPCLSGAATPTEIWRAARLGADGVKVFPAALLGDPGYLAALREPLEGVRLVPTGGVTVDTARAYLEAGASTVGVGSAVSSRSWMAEGGVAPIAGTMAAFGEALQ